MKEILESQVSPETWEIYQKALAGDAEAQNSLGDIFYLAKEVEEDYKEAAYWFRLAADQGHIEATYNLGFCYKYGYGVKQDPYYAIFFLEKSAQAGFHKAEFHYGEMLCRGTGGEQDLERGMMFLKRSCSKGNEYAPYELSQIYSSGILGAPDNKKYLRCIQLSASRGYARAQAYLGKEYFVGELVETNFDKGMEWCLKAAEGGNPEACYHIGVAYANGENVRISVKKAITWFLKGAEKGHTGCMEHLVDIYRGKSGTKPNEKKAKMWEDKLSKYKPKPVPAKHLLTDSAFESLPDGIWQMYNAATEGNVRAQYDFAVALRDGEMIPKNLPLSREWLKIAADNGHPEAQYHYGSNFSKSPMEKIDWLTKSAEQGDRDAQFELAGMYLDGKDIEKNSEKGIEWLKKAADGGNIPACRRLGEMYQFGEGISRDPNAAKHYLETAAIGGNTRAMISLGVLLYKDRDYPHEYEEAAGWFRAAAAKGDTFAMSWLAFCYKEGRGVRRNMNYCFEWAKRAAEKNEMSAFRYLGECYRDGSGTEQDYVLAVETFDKGFRLGDEVCAENLYSLYCTDARFPENPGKAAEYLNYLAEQNPDNILLGRELLVGNVMKGNLAKAAEILSKAGGNNACLTTTGLMYMAGKGVRQSYGKARQQFEKAAERDDGLSNLMLAKIYHDGLGVEKDVEKSDRYLVKAAENGNLQAVSILLLRERKIDPSLRNRDDAYGYDLFNAIGGKYEEVAKRLAEAPQNNRFVNILAGLLNLHGLVEGSSDEKALAHLLKAGMAGKGFAGEAYRRMGNNLQALKYFKSSLYTPDEIGMRGITMVGDGLVNEKTVAKWADIYARINTESLYEKDTE